MKLVILVACALVAVAVAAPAEYEPEPILRSSFDQDPEGGFNYGFETAKGIVVQANGELKEALDEENKPHVVVVVRGSYSYTDPKGQVVTIEYKADENGYEAKGDSIPKVPARR